MAAITSLLACLFSLGVLFSRAPGRASDAPPAAVTVTVEGGYHGVPAHVLHRKLVRMRHLAYQRLVAGNRARHAARAAIGAGYGNSWLERAFLCIHRFEGSWTDPNAPYWGGLQMDGDFMRHYGGWALKAFGTADHWPVSVQLSTAIEAKVSGRGFYPWPNTARACGLL